MEEQIIGEQVEVNDNDDETTCITSSGLVLVGEEEEYYYNGLTECVCDSPVYAVEILPNGYLKDIMFCRRCRLQIGPEGAD